MVAYQSETNQYFEVVIRGNTSEGYSGLYYTDIAAYKVTLASPKGLTLLGNSMQTYFYINTSDSSNSEST